MIVMAVSKVLPYITGIFGAAGTATTAVTSNGDALLIAIVGGCFLIANSVITIIVTKFLENDHTRKTKEKTKNTHHHSNSDPNGGT